MRMRIHRVPMAHAVRMRWNRVRMATNRVFVRSLR